MVVRMLQNECIVNLMAITDVMCFTVSGHVYVFYSERSCICFTMSGHVYVFYSERSCICVLQ